MATNVAFVVAIVAVSLLLGPLCLAIGHGARGSAALRGWGWALILYTAGLLVQVSTLSTPHRVSFFVGASLVAAASVVGVRGVLTLTGRRLDPRLVGSAFAVIVAVLAANNFGRQPNPMVNLFAPALLAIPLFATGGGMLLAWPPADARRAARFAAWAMLFAAVLWGTRLLYLSGAFVHLSPAAADPRNAELVRSLFAVGQIFGTVWSTIALFAIEVRRMESALTRTALTDALTGLANRRATMERFREEASRARRLDQPFALLLADVDHFKKINDERGHLAGDFVLQKLARLLADGSRAEDAVGRIGGEEFVLLLQRPGLDEALRAAERIRESVANERLVHEGRPLPITISLGLALFPLDGEDWDPIFARADERLYASKRGGRNRVTGPPPAGALGDAG